MVIKIQISLYAIKLCKQRRASKIACFLDLNEQDLETYD